MLLLYYILFFIVIILLLLIMFKMITKTIVIAHSTPRSSFKGKGNFLKRERYFV